MTKKYDVIVIGTGAAASAVALRCREAGWQVAIVDSRPFGGTCALRGCDPKKVLVGAGEVLDWSRRMLGKGIEAENLHIDWPQLMRFKRSFTEPFHATRSRVRERRYRRFPWPRALRRSNNRSGSRREVGRAVRRDCGWGGAGQFGDPWRRIPDDQRPIP